MASSLSISLCFVFLTQLLFLSSSANLHQIKRLQSELHRSNQTITPNTTTASPTVFFEVTKPIKVPRTKPCSYLVLHHDFAYTYGRPPVLANYTPPSESDCPSHNFAKIVFEWTATSRGTQYDRIFGVWLGGAELLRSCTAEPRATGIIWTVKKDITRYYSLLMKNQTLAVYLANIVTSTYTGVYHVNISIHFYPGDVGYAPKANLILPISRNPPLSLSDGFWFEIENNTDVGLKEFKIPQNVYRAVLEVYVSFHGDDEFWYGNVPNDYIAANNLTDTPGNGPFREVVVTLDGQVVGAIWPFTVVYTGGINPLLWRPITGIGSFDLPTYDIEITPFLGRILDGKTHKFGFSVTNALDVWYIDANLHLWLDDKSTKTEGKLVSSNSLPLVVSEVSDFVGLNGNFSTISSRAITSTGWVNSSHGNITTTSNQGFNFSNKMLMGKDGDLQIVNQIILFNNTVYADIPSLTVHFIKSNKNFTLFMYSDYLDQGNGSALYLTNLTLGFDENKSMGVGRDFSTWGYLKNVQNGQGTMVVKNNLVDSGLGSTQQAYEYDGEFCYFRNVSSSNYTFLYDIVNNTCKSEMQSRTGLGLGRMQPLPVQRSFLAS